MLRVAIGRASSMEPRRATIRAMGDGSGAPQSADL